MVSTRQVQLTLAFQAFTPAAGKDAWKSHHEAGRDALRLALGAQGLAGEVTPHGEHGFLELTDRGKAVPGVYLNVSHTDGMAVGVVSPFPVGVDVEALTRDPSRALGRQMSDRDRANLQKLGPLPDPRLTGPLLLWTAKEAFAKALGLGMQAGMPRLEIDLLAPAPFPARTEVKGWLALLEPRIHWEIRGEFLVSVCTEARALASGITRIPA